MRCWIRENTLRDLPDFAKDSMMGMLDTGAPTYLADGPALVVSATWMVVASTASALVLQRRDVQGRRRPGIPSPEGDVHPPLHLDTEGTAMNASSYPVSFSVDYPDRSLDRVSTLFRLFIALPILVVLGAVSAWAWGGSSGDDAGTGAAGAGGLLFLAPLLMIVFRQKYPRWWFDWSLELQRFMNRVGVYLALMTDRYPSTDDAQSVHLDYAYPDVPRDLNRWMPLVKWLLAIPHVVVLVVLNLAAVVAVALAWVAILFTGRYPKGLFGFVEGVFRWNNRVIGYALTLVTDTYPPFRLAP